MYGEDLACVLFFSPLVFFRTSNEMGMGLSFDVFLEWQIARRVILQEADDN